MQGKKLFLDKEVIRFRLSKRVPPHNLYRRLAELVDWTFLYEETWALYSHTGQPSLDPIGFFKLLLVGRAQNHGRKAGRGGRCARATKSISTSICSC